MYYSGYSELESPLHHVTPSAKLLVGALVMLSMTLVFDPVTPALMIALALGLLLVVGRVPPGLLVRALWPVALAALGFFWVGVAFPRASEAVTVVGQIGPFTITAEALWRAGAIGLRVLRRSPWPRSCWASTILCRLRSSFETRSNSSRVWVDLPDAAW